MKKPSLRSRSALTLAAILATAISPSPGLRAAGFIWDGGGTDSNWSTGPNWAGNVPPLSSVSTTISFNASPRLSSVVTAALSLNSLTFNQGSNHSIISGQTLSFGESGITSPSIVQGSAAPVSISNPVSLFDPLEIAGGGSGMLTFTGPISGPASLSKSGTPTLRLMGANTYLGSTLLLADGTAGGIGVGNDSALSSNALRVFSPRPLFAIGAARTLANAIELNNSLPLIADPLGVNNLTLNGNVTGTGGLAVNIPGGVVTLGGASANTFTGETSVRAGTLLLNKSANIQALGGDLSVGNNFFPTAPASVIVRIQAAQQTGAATDLSIFEDGLFDITAAGTTVGTLSMTGGEARLGAKVLTLGGNVTINASAAGSKITSIDYFDDLSLGNVARTFTVANGAALYDLDVQAGVAAGTLVKAGPGVIRLAGITNTGLAVTLNEGTLALASNTALDTPANRTFTMAGGTVVADGADRTLSNPIALSGPSPAIGASLDGTPRALTFSGAATVAASTTLDVSNSAATTFSNTVSLGGELTLLGTGALNLTNVVSGAGRFTKFNSATLLLTGANTFSGGVNLRDGSIGIGNDAALGTGALTHSFSGEVFAAGANRTVSNPVVLDSGILTITPDPAGARSLTFTGAISGLGALLVNVPGETVTLGGAVANTFTGSTFVDRGTLLLNKAANVLALGGDLSVGNMFVPGAPASVIVRTQAAQQTGAATDLSIFEDGLFDITAAGTTVGTLSMTGGEARLGARILNLRGNVTINASAAGSKITSTDFFNDLDLGNAPRTFTVANGGALYDLDVQAGVARGTLVKAGPGVIRLAGVSNSDFAVTLNAGTLALASNTALGVGTFTMAGGTLVADGADRNLSNPFALSGISTIGASLDGTPRALTFSGLVTAAASTTLFVTNSAATTFSNRVSLAGELTLLTSGSLNLANVVLGPGRLTKFESGTLMLSGSNTFSGGVELRGGNIGIGNNTALGTGALTHTFSGGVFAAGANRTVNNPILLISGFPLAITADPVGAHTLTLTGVISGPGGLTGSGAGGLTLEGANTFTGGLSVENGPLNVTNDSNLGGPGNSVTLAASLLTFANTTTTARTYNLSATAALTSAPGTTITYAAGAQVNGGNLGAEGAHVFADGSRLSGTTALENSVLSQSGGTVTFDAVTLRGSFTQAAGATLNATNGLTLSPPSTLAINGTINLANGAELNGVAAISSTGRLLGTAGLLVLNTGSSTTIAAGGQIAGALNGTIEVNGGELVNNGLQTGGLNVNLGGRVKGGGAFGTVNLADGGRFSPGNIVGGATASGDVTFGAGGRFDFELNSAEAAPGAGTDFLSVAGGLNIGAGSAPGTRLTLAIISLDGGNNAAPLIDFNANKSYAFIFSTAAGGIAGFTPEEFSVDTSGFLNDLGGGSFAVLQDGNSLVLAFTPIPEPSTWALLALGVAGLGRRPARRNVAAEVAC